MRSIRRALIPALVALLVAAGAGPVSASSGDTVQLRDGTIRGSVKPGYREFLGVPFAAPPVGERRFAPPAPVRPWAGTLRTQASRSWCPQALPFVGSLVPSAEDCLYLDVVTPTAAASKKLPVMVWIYGGAYLLGASGQYRMNELVTRGEVVGVALNYRVGPFGFLKTPGLQGNYGLQDQQAALRWVRDNIDAFGGDPANVTVFGESAGGNSVCQQLASPAARGLFHRAIVQSGACGSGSLDGQTVAEADATGLEFARSLGCTDPAGVVACLRGKPRSALLDAPLAQFRSMEVGFRPVVDGTLLPAPSGDVFAAGRQAQVPVLIGSNLDEGRLFVALFQHLTKLRRTTPEDRRAALTELFGADAGRIEAAYTPARYGSADLALAAVYTDALFACPGGRATRSLARTGPATYAYEFREPNTPTSGLDPLMPLGAHHAAELAYLGLLPVDLPLPAAGRRLSDRMIAAWTTFARTGRPGIGWPLASTGTLRTLAAAGSGTDTLDAFDARHRCDLWAP